MAVIVGCAGPTTPPPKPTARPKAEVASEVPTRVLEGLTGKVKAPAAWLVSDRGTGMISDHASGIVSNNGSTVVSRVRFGLLQAEEEQVPVPNARVTLLDGSGDPVMQDGKAVETTSDAEGVYVFANAPEDKQCVVSVELPAAAGVLLAIAPPGARNRNVDVELVSTITTGYILEDILAPVPNPQQALERLQPSVELQLREGARRALVKVAIKPPSSPSLEGLLELMDSLRSGDQQLAQEVGETKKQLVPACPVILSTYDVNGDRSWTRQEFLAYFNNTRGNRRSSGPGCGGRPPVPPSQQTRAVAQVPMPPVPTNGAPPLPTNGAPPVPANGAPPMPPNGAGPVPPNGAGPVPPNGAVPVPSKVVRFPGGLTGPCDVTAPQLFQTYDVDKSGTLDEGEICAMVGATGP
jgi:hypothetical protein